MEDGLQAGQHYFTTPPHCCNMCRMWFGIAEISKGVPKQDTVQMLLQNLDVRFSINGAFTDVQATHTIGTYALRAITDSGFSEQWTIWMVCLEDTMWFPKTIWNQSQTKVHFSTFCQFILHVFSLKKLAELCTLQIALLISGFSFCMVE